MPNPELYHMVETQWNHGSDSTILYVDVAGQMAAGSGLLISSQYCRQRLWCWRNVPKFKDEGWGEGDAFDSI